MPEHASKQYHQIRARLLQRGKTIRRWAIENSLPLGSVYNAINGTRNGVQAQRIRSSLETFLNE